MRRPFVKYKSVSYGEMRTRNINCLKLDRGILRDFIKRMGDDYGFYLMGTRGVGCVVGFLVKTGMILRIGWVDPGQRMTGRPWDDGNSEISNRTRACGVSVTLFIAGSAGVDEPLEDRWQRREYHGDLLVTGRRLPLMYGNLRARRGGSGSRQRKARMCGLNLYERNGSISHESYRRTSAPQGATNTLNTQYKNGQLGTCCPFCSLLVYYSLVGSAFGAQLVTTTCYVVLHSDQPP